MFICIQFVYIIVDNMKLFFFLVEKLALHGRSIISLCEHYIISWRGGDSTIKSAIVGCTVVLCDLCVH